MQRRPATTMSNFPTRTAVSEAEDGKSWIPTPPPPFLSIISAYRK